MSDQADKDAESMETSTRRQAGGLTMSDQKYVDEIIAALQARDQEIERLKKQITDLEPVAAKWWQVYQDQCEGAYIEATIVKELKADVQSLKNSVENWKAADRDKFDEISRLKAESARLEERFPCNHRKVDWDDSYGECVVCKFKAMADDYDRLPITVIECHDRILELEAESAARYVKGLKQARDIADGIRIMWKLSNELPPAHAVTIAIDAEIDKAKAEK